MSNIGIEYKKLDETDFNIVEGVLSKYGLNIVTHPDSKGYYIYSPITMKIEYAYIYLDESMLRIDSGGFCCIFTMRDLSDPTVDLSTNGQVLALKEYLEDSANIVKTSWEKFMEGFIKE